MEIKHHKNYYADEIIKMDLEELIKDRADKHDVRSHFSTCIALGIPYSMAFELTKERFGL